jgi:hypothetical protein
LFEILSGELLFKEVFMKRSLSLGLSVIACSTLLAQRPSLTPNPIIGTWKQDMEKSTYSPGPPPSKGTYSVRQYAAGDDGSIVAITMNVDARGLPSLGAISAANYDGREYVQHTVATLATSLGSHIGPRLDRTISYKYVDQYTVQIVQKQDDETVSASTRTISRDGKTMTDRFDYTNATGQRVTNVLVFEKQ